MEKRGRPSLPGRADRLEKLYSKVDANSWDTESWNAILVESTSRGESEVVSTAYERFLARFPSSARHWLSLLDYHFKQRSPTPTIEAIFNKCLRAIPDVELWKVYLGYIRRLHPVTNVTLEKKTEARAVITQAYEFVLSHVGVNKDSGQMWTDYLYFIKAGETISMQEDQQRMDQMRKVYHRAISIPLNNIEQIWKEYDAFENGLSRLTAKKFISDQSARYMAARTSLPQLKNLIAPLAKYTKHYLSKPPTFSEKETLILYSYKQWISWERRNPMNYDDISMVHQRVIYAYKSALLNLRHWPELWSEYAAYLREAGKMTEAGETLKQAVSVIPGSLLLSFCSAEHLEAAQKPWEEVATVFDETVSHLTTSLQTVSKIHEDEAARLKTATIAATSNPDEFDGEARELLRKEEKKIEDKRSKEVKAFRDQIGLVWCQYMKVARRVGGVKLARTIFSKARKSGECSWHVFVASALMEYHISKDMSVATRIFEFGWQNMAKTADDETTTKYAEEYLNFLIGLNDDNNIHALFERTLATVSASHARPIWDKFEEYENRYGDLPSLAKIEQRKRLVYPDAESMTDLIKLSRKYDFLDLAVIAEKELGLSAIKLYFPRFAKAAAQVQARSGGSATNLFDPSQNRSRPNLLQPVHPERFDRPDLSKWTELKPEDGGQFPSSSSADDVNPLHMLVAWIGDRPWSGPTISADVCLTLLQTLPIPSDPAAPSPAPSDIEAASTDKRKRSLEDDPTSRKKIH